MAAAPETATLPPPRMISPASHVPRPPAGLGAAEPRQKVSQNSASGFGGFIDNLFDRR